MAAETVNHTPPLVRYVPATFPMAIQTIAALEERIREYQGYADRGADVAFVVADCHAMIALVRETFDLWPEPATFDREQARAQFVTDHPEYVHPQPAAFDPSEGSPDPIPGRVLAYWNHGA